MKAIYKILTLCLIALLGSVNLSYSETFYDPVDDVGYHQSVEADALVVVALHTDLFQTVDIPASEYLYHSQVSEQPRAAFLKPTRSQYRNGEVRNQTTFINNLRKRHYWPSQVYTFERPLSKIL